MKRRATLPYQLGLILALLLSSCVNRSKGEIAKDEAASAGVDDRRFVHADEDYFHDMDGAIVLDATEIKGRNMWMVWTGGNDRLWNYLSKPTWGAFDLLKIVAPPPDSDIRRPMRWDTVGVVNEPCFREASAPDPQRFGLYLDARDPACPPDPFADEGKYPGVKTGARGTRLPNGQILPVGSYYGWPTGIVGLRLFTNPAFDAKAYKAWDPGKYYSDPRYYNNPNLVRPYRVGMACAFCHVGPSPTRPPADRNNPTWANLSATVGAQYLWANRLFFWKPRPDNFIYQWISTARPGAIDTSLVSSDNINNPRTQNAIYNLGDRLSIATRIGEEKLAGGGLKNPQFNDFVKEGWLTHFFKKPDTVWTPHVLKDGADSVGALGALNRVHLNIGMYSEEWLRHFNPVMGGKPVSPIVIANAQKNSAYWRATERGTPAEALFFLKAAQPNYLKDAPGGAALLAADASLVSHGGDVFAERCARCHSSKQPKSVPAFIKFVNGPGYLESFRRWFRWTQSVPYRRQMKEIVRAPDFRNGNYLSTDARVPVTLLRTNLCSPLATNAIRGNIWDNFSSETYKKLPSVGTVAVINPFTGRPVPYPMPAGGRGYTRVPSLVSLWSTGPYLLNNTVGPFSYDPSVPARVAVFKASITQMLFPETRPAVVDRTTNQTSLFIPRSYLRGLPDLLTKEDNGLLRKLVDANGDIEIGPIPKGTPINLLANLRPLSESQKPSDIAAHYHDVIVALVRLKAILISIKGRSLSDEQLRKAFEPMRDPLLKLSKCPDFIVNRGHYFGTDQFNQGLTRDERSWGYEAGLTPADKQALIAFLMTL